MILQDYGPGGVSVALPDDLRWVDEFEWTAIARKSTYTCSGALLIQEGEKQAGRPITLQAPEDMAWVPRSVVKQLHQWAGTANLKLRLTLEYPDDTRQFYVMFNPEEQSPLESAPVKGIPGHNDGDEYTVKIKLIEVQP
jgi:hypothetical protein